MTTWPILSVVTFLPVVGALLIYLSRAAATKQPTAMRAGSRCGPR